jgi:hypothetical protein
VPPSARACPIDFGTFDAAKRRSRNGAMPPNGEVRERPGRQTEPDEEAGSRSGGLPLSRRPPVIRGHGAPPLRFRRNVPCHI